MKRHNTTQHDTTRQEDASQWDTGGRYLEDSCLQETGGRKSWKLGEDGHSWGRYNYGHGYMTTWARARREVLRDTKQWRQTRDSGLG